jgi:hypothetical protein
MQKSLRSTLSAAALFAAAACSPGSDVAGPSALASGPIAELVGDRDDVYDVTPGVVNVCAFFTPYSPGVTATFSASAPAGEDLINGNFSISPFPSCIEVWNKTDGDAVTVGASWVSSPGWQIERIYRVTGDGVNPSSGVWLYNVSSASVNVSDLIGGQIWFKMKPADVPPPPQGGEGCTPGYWRQSQHFDSWTAPYAPTTLFNDVFAGGFPGLTLLDVVWMGGGGINALGRHAVAALLNSASGDVSYDLSVQQVLDRYNASYLGSRSVQNDAKNVFEMLNEQGCTIN